MNNPVEGQKLSIDAVRFASQSIEVEPCLPPRIEIGNMMTMYGLVKIDLLQALRGAPQKQPSSPGACFVSVPTVIPVDTGW
jgi:hypothetical protein